MLCCPQCQPFQAGVPEGAAMQMYSLTLDHLTLDHLTPPHTLLR